MVKDQKQIETFLQEYERIFNEALAGSINPAATANFFADGFIANISSYNLDLKCRCTWAFCWFSVT